MFNSKTIITQRLFDVSNEDWHNEANSYSESQCILYDISTRVVLDSFNSY